MLIPIWGFTSAANTLVSYVIGQNRQDEVIPLIFKILKLSIVGVIVLVLINMIIPETIISIYTNNKLLIKDSLPALYVVSISALFLTVGFILFSGVSGTGMTKISFIIEVIVMIMYIGITYTLVNVSYTSIELVWSVEIFYGIIIGLLSIAYLKFGNWKNKEI